ncbi:SDR family NAD(P)-dependent oxidoreductase [Variovorax guangxiensis]|uniref:SDR family oxidoreductase n=1 Tax=Variovorax guangxiensis TaxID=1775474 RepID=A0A502DLY2_9BURK|nr:SDR family NAD(P)-dependent oxidoreductase [Variovorax guangxiensis]TPG22176.1 SDR family oxidoreductase [Variovorax ginsengisoli]TPG26064.1 SDR family oxidoreductase [Variovorax guangxiensis]
MTTAGRLKGRVVVITGACGSIGRATTLRLALEGPEAIVALDAQSNFDRLAEAVRATGPDVVCLSIDCTKPDAIAAGFRQIHDRFARVDVLINTVGGSVRGKIGEFWCSEPSTWQRVIDLSLMSAMWCAREVVPGMRERGRGSIVNIASSAATLPIASMVDYGAAKAGVLGFTRGLALELAPFGVNVNAVSPGPIDTFGLQQLPLVRQRSLEGVPMGRLGSPEEIAAAVAFLAGDDGSFVTGQNLQVNGGKAFS